MCDVGGSEGCMCVCEGMRGACDSEGCEDACVCVRV